MWRFWGILFVLVLAALVGYMSHAIQTEAMSIRLLADSKLSVTYPDLIAIILTAFAVIMAIGSIALATAAIIGWNTIESKAMKMAAAIINEDLTNEESGKLQKVIKSAITDSSSPLHKTLKTEAQKLMYSGVAGLGGTDEGAADNGHS